MPKFGAGICIHCGKYFQELTADHILPSSWYPESTPADLEKWQAPSCKSCNANYGKFERALFQQLAMGVEPYVPGGEGIGDRAIRSFDPSKAKSEVDKKHREAAREKVRLLLKQVEQISPNETIFPNVGTIYPPTNGTYAIQELEWADLERIIVKFIRGISYLATGTVLPSEYVIHVVRPEVYSQMPQALLSSPAQTFERGRGFRVDRHAATDDKYAALFRIFLWGKYEFFGAIWNSALERRPNAG